MKLQLGCGVNVWPGYVNLDKDDHGQEVVRDVLHGLPFDDNKFDEVYSANFMEHIRQGDDVYFVMSEIWRVSTSGALVKIIVPASDTPFAFYPDHLSYWNELSVAALCNDGYQRSRTLKYDFDLVSTSRDGIVPYELIINLKAKK